MKKWFNPLVISLLLLAISITFVVGFNTNWGTVDVDRSYIHSENGNRYSYVSYIQKAVSNENPGPAVILFHGNNDSSQGLNSWSVEILRRGYNVFNLDLSGVMMSDTDFSDDTALAMEFVEYVQSLPFIDSEKILVTGHSKGGSTVSRVVDAMDVAGGVAVSAMRAYKQWGDTFDGNMVTVIGTGDWMNRLYELEKMNQNFMQMVYGTDGSLPEFGKEYGSVAEKNYRSLIVYDGLFAQHCAARWSPKVIGIVCENLGKIVPTDTTLDPYSQIVLFHVFFSLLAMISLAATAINLMIALSKQPFFAAAKTAVPECIGLTGKKWWISALQSMVPSLLIFIVMNYVADKYLGMSKATELFPVAVTNRFILFFLCLGAYEIIMFYVGFWRKKKVSAAQCGLLWNGGIKTNAVNIGKSALLAAVGAGIALTFLYIFEVGFGMSLQAFFMQMRAASLERVSRSLMYLPILFVLYFGMQFGANISRRLAPTGSDTKDMLRDVVVNCLLGTALIGIFFFVNMWCNDHSLFWDVVDEVGHAYYMYNYLLLANIATAANTVLYRKTGTIWSGVFFCTIFLGVLIPSGCPIL